MAEITGIEANNNGKAIKNVLDDSDDLCWFSSGAVRPCITLRFSERVAHVHVEFQRGFQPRRISAVEAGEERALATHFLDACECTANIALGNGAECLCLILEESFDPYGRFCIYRIYV